MTSFDYDVMIIGSGFGGSVGSATELGDRMGEDAGPNFPIHRTSG